MIHSNIIDDTQLLQSLQSPLLPQPGQNNRIKRAAANLPKVTNATNAEHYSWLCF